MYNNYKLVTLILNTKGGASETIEALTKEVDGQTVPCTKAEAEIKFLNKISSVGGNPATQSIKCVLFNSDGNIIKEDEVIKDAPIEA